MTVNGHVNDRDPLFAAIGEQVEATLGPPPDERFRRVLEAYARGDDETAAELVESCPMRAYRISDPAYMDRVDASRHLAAAVALEVGPHSGARGRPMEQPRSWQRCLRTRKRRCASS